MSTLSKFYATLETHMELNALLKAISKELSNRNIPALFAYNSPDTEDIIELSDLKELYEELAKDVDFSNKESISSNKYSDFSNALRLQNGAEFDNPILMFLLAKHFPGIDEYVNYLDDFTVLTNNEIRVGADGMIELVDGMELRQHALLVPSKNLMLYPHQFLRRFYHSSFASILQILNRLHRGNSIVRLRMDPLRKSEPKFYSDFIEHDRWFGPPFKPFIFKDKSSKPKVTIHRTSEDDRRQWLTYPLRFTIFRSDMLDSNMRQFFIEEYTPIRNSVYEHQTPCGAGERFVIQKFCHFVYDQDKDAFEHIDGAVRTFEKDKYLEIYDCLIAGRAPAKKIGHRYKLFEVRGKLNLQEVQEILEAYFLYNPHLSEFFCNADE